MYLSRLGNAIIGSKNRLNQFRAFSSVIALTAIVIASSRASNVRVLANNRGIVDLKEHDKTYQTVKIVAEDFKETMEIFSDDFLPQWNYSVKPQRHSELQVI